MVGKVPAGGRVGSVRKSPAPLRSGQPSGAGRAKSVPVNGGGRVPGMGKVQAVANPRAPGAWKSPAVPRVVGSGPLIKGPGPWPRPRVDVLKRMGPGGLLIKGPGQ